METEAHCEMKEIEEMLSLFGSDPPSTTLDAQDKRFNLLISVHVEKAFVPACTLEGTENIPLNLGKPWKPKNTHKPRMQKRERTKRSPAKEKVHIMMCVNVRSLVVAFT